MYCFITIMRPILTNFVILAIPMYVFSLQAAKKSEEKDEEEEGDDEL